MTCAWEPMPVMAVGGHKAARKTSMAEKKESRIAETATEARQAEPGPSILLILIVSVVLAVILLGAVWLIFFRT